LLGELEISGGFVQRPFGFRQLGLSLFLLLLLAVAFGIQGGDLFLHLDDVQGADGQTGQYRYD
jgi:hypothetical protein